MITTVNKLPKLNLCSSLSKANLNNGSGVAIIFSLVKSTYTFNQEFSFGLKSTDLTFKLTHITFNYGAFELSLGSWAIERQNNQVEHYVSSYLFNHYFRVFISFQNKTQRFHYITLSSLSNIWYLWILIKANIMLCLSFRTTKAYMELIGMVILWTSILAIHIL
jgi:hypothetical protein